MDFNSKLTKLIHSEEWSIGTSLPHSENFLDTSLYNWVASPGRAVRWVYSGGCVDDDEDDDDDDDDDD